MQLSRAVLVGSVVLFSIACGSSNIDEELEPIASLDQAVSSCVAGAAPTTGVTLSRAFGPQTFATPVVLAQAPNDSSRFYVVSKNGVVRRTDASGTSTSTFIDLTSRVNASPNEAGLLGMAFHPSFAQNGYVYFSYTKPSTTSPANLRSVIARGKSSDGGLSIPTSSLVELLSFDQPYSNHNGGSLAFGKDGMLYAGFGDGGSAGDPGNRAQDKTSLMGKVLRLDVDGGSPYAIPSTNPFAQGGGRGEIYALGLRNPWRMSFDRVTGDLWLGDVGQSALEEIDRIVLGGNYGWKLREGTQCYAQPCTAPNLIDPHVTYPRSEGYSVTGGFVYRGTAIPSLTGRYVYGDFGTGKIWSVATSGASPTPALLLASGKSIAAFGEDASGELYVLDYGSGEIWKIVPGAVTGGGPPSLLSQTGCFSGTSTNVPNASLVPYDVNAPLWSDNATKARWLSLPPGGKIRVNADGDWDLPNGSVLVKEFKLGTTRIETRLFVRHTNGTWAGYTYEWNAAQTDATLLTTGKTKTVGGQSWTIPSRSDCMGCHVSAAGSTLGLETAQLNRSFAYASGTQNQLTYLANKGVFSTSAPLPSAPWPALPSPSSTSATTEARARSYLHANCSFCHKPGGPGGGPPDLRFTQSVANMHVCDVTPERGDLGVWGAKIVSPGDATSSVLSLRMHANSGAGRMPQLGTSIVDQAGTAVVDAWINGLESCP